MQTLDYLHLAFSPLHSIGLHRAFSPYIDDTTWVWWLISFLHDTPKISSILLYNNKIIVSRVCLAFVFLAPHFPHLHDILHPLLVSTSSSNSFLTTIRFRNGFPLCLFPFSSSFLSSSMWKVSKSGGFTATA